MPIKKAAFKHLRQTRVRTVKNQSLKKSLANLLKTTRRAFDAGDYEKAKTALASTIKAIDKAAKQGLLKPNAASRKKSALMRRANSLKKPSS